MKLLITGGAGFIGAHLLRFLVGQENVEVTVLDNLTSGRLEHIPASVRFVKGDVRDLEIENLFAKEKFDGVIHLAAQTMVPYSLKYPREDCDINLHGIINVLECCRKYGVKNIVFSSSSAIYGNNLNIPIKENEPAVPVSFYGITKMASEHYLRVYHELYGINTTVLRFANVYGEMQGEGGEGGVISIFCKLLAQGKGVTVFGNGEQTRDFIYAGDVAEILFKASSLSGFNILNVSTKQEISLNQLLEAFHQAVGHDFPITYQGIREGDIFRSVLDNGKCQQVLNITPQTNILEGVKRTYADYLKRMEAN